MNGNDFLGLPVWAKVVGFLGFPTALSLLLLAVFFGWIRSPLTDIVSQNQQQLILMGQILRGAEAARNEEHAAIDYQNILLRTLCRSIAKDMNQCEPRYRGYEEPQR